LANTIWSEVVGNEIGEKLNIKPFLLFNDFHVLSYGVLGLNNSSLIPLIEIDKEHKDGVKVVCGPGTGLGIAMLLPIGSGNY